MQTYNVTFTGTGAGDATGASSVKENATYTFTVNEQDGFEYTITATMGGKAVTVTGSNGSYSIANVTGDLVITIAKKSTTTTMDVAVSKFVEMNNKTVFLVTVTGTPEEGKAFAYGENVMYKTTAYGENVYSWLVIVDGTADLTAADAEAKITQAAATAEEVAAGYDVNETNVVDINDAQLTYDIYTGKYTDFEKVSVRKFLRADTNADKVVNSADAVVVVASSKADGKLKYQPGAIMTNLLLADEINRTSSKTQSALLEAMEELQVTVDGVTRLLPKPFVVLATENPVGSAGTQMLPASQLDRFLIRLSMGYPNRASTAALLKDRHHVDPLSACQTVTTPDELEKLIADVVDIHVADRIYDYIAELVDVTRSNAYVTLGVSPRGALAVTRAAKANAYLEGRNYVIPDDVCAVFPDVCVHRLILNAKARLQEYTAAQILQNILTSVQKPDIREFTDK